MYDLYTVDSNSKPCQILAKRLPDIVAQLTGLKQADILVNVYQWQNPPKGSDRSKHVVVSLVTNTSSHKPPTGKLMLLIAALLKKEAPGSSFRIEEATFCGDTQTITCNA